MFGLGVWGLRSRFSVESVGLGFRVQGPHLSQITCFKGEVLGSGDNFLRLAQGNPMVDMKTPVCP